MSEPVGTILKDILARHGRDLLEDSRRFNNILRDTEGLERRDREALIMVLKERVPRQLVDTPAGLRTTTMVANLAKRIAKETPLSEELARWGIEAWCGGLELKISAERDSPIQEGAGPAAQAAAKAQVAHIETRRGWENDLSKRLAAGLDYITSVLGRQSQSLIVGTTTAALIASFATFALQRWSHSLDPLYDGPELTAIAGLLSPYLAALAAILAVVGVLGCIWLVTPRIWKSRPH